MRILVGWISFNLRLTLSDTIFLVLIRLMTSSWIQEEMAYPLMRTISSPIWRSHRSDHHHFLWVVIECVATFLSVLWHCVFASLQMSDNNPSTLHAYFAYKSCAHRVRMSFRIVFSSRCQTGWLCHLSSGVSICVTGY